MPATGLLKCLTIAKVLFLVLQCARGATVVKYNVGGPAVAGFDSDPERFATSDSEIYVADGGISGIAASHRWTSTSTFAYEVPVKNGTYDVTLYWAEVYPNNDAVGKRIFHVAIEGVSVVNNLDVFKEVGFEKLLSKKFETVNVSDETLSVALTRGSAGHPMLSAFKIASSTNAEVIVAGSGKGDSEGKNTQGFDHQAHAVAGGPYVAQDFNNDKKVEITLDGSLSHSHWFDPETGKTGQIKKFEWRYEDKVISKEPNVSYSFPLGDSEVLLTVEDQAGDVATAVAKVLGKPGGAGGVYCYYYAADSADFKLSKGLEDGPRPSDAASSSTVEFPTVDSFPYFNKSKQKLWAARCVSKLTVPSTKTYKLSLSCLGDAMLYIDGNIVIDSSSSATKAEVSTKSASLAGGDHSFELIFYKRHDAAELVLTLDGDGGEGLLVYDTSSIVPVIRALSLNYVSPQGGGQVQIVGSGFFNDESVKIGDADAVFTKSSSSELVVGIPSQDQAGGENVTQVVVCNAAGCSNAKELTFSNNATHGIQFAQSFFKNQEGGQFGISQVSSAALGPDGKYYFGTLSGVVHQIEVDKDLNVISSCQSEAVGSGRVILGVAFNPTDRELKLYVSTSALYWGFGDNPMEQSWANGQIETFEPGCGCLCKKDIVISGLPVSNHDHSVNGLEFTDNGDLFILVGGSTNAGHNTPGNKLGGVDESPLSAACLFAKLSKGDSFDGAVTYDQYNDPGIANQVSGLDVSVYASGLRNPVDLVLTTDGLLFATDNGDNAGFGDKSMSCTTQEALSISSQDEVNLLVNGGYYGHPNRNRGRNDSSQCEYKAGAKPLVELESSSDGIIEYTSFAFDGGLKGDLLVSKYAVQGTGKLYRLARHKQNGSHFVETELAQFSGMSMTEGLHGEVVMPRVQQSHIAVLQPVYTPPKLVPFLLKVTPRRAMAGSAVFITGNNLSKGNNLSITFGNKPCLNLSIIDDGKARCVLPAGTGVVAVSASNTHGKSKAGVDFVFV